MPAPCPNLWAVETRPGAEHSRSGLIWPGPQWLALFYDLAFAAGIIAIAGSYGYDHSVLGAVWFATAYGIIASAWLLTGGATGAFSSQPKQATTLVVVVIVIQMAAVLMLSVASGDSIASSSGLFDGLLGLLLATCLVLGWLARAGVHVSTNALPARVQWLVVVAGAALVVAWLVPDAPGLIVWLAALGALALAGAMVTLDSAIDVHRLAHRLGELTIIIVGEVLVKMALTADDESVWSVELVELGAALVLLVGVFWAYFTGPVKVSSLAGGRRLMWVTAHWALHVALLGLAVGMSKLLVGSESLDEPGALLALLTGPALLIWTSLAVLDWVTGVARWRVAAVTAAAVAVVAAVTAITELQPVLAAYAVGVLPLIGLTVTNRNLRPPTSVGSPS